MQHFMDVAKALADRNRVRTLLILRDRELCVCQITEILGLAPSTVSKHMSILRRAGLVEMRKDGRWAYYRLIAEKAAPVAEDAIAWAVASAAESQEAQNDIRTLKAVLKMDPEVLCKKQSGR